MIVAKIVLVIDEKEVCIEVKDAEKLYEDLYKIFGKKEYVLPDVGRIYPQLEDRTCPPYVWYSTGRAGE